ncbi:MAG: protein kinase [Planctomycetota bacterium]
MPPCPFCKQELTDDDLSRDACPSCGRALSEEEPTRIIQPETIRDLWGKSLHADMRPEMTIKAAGAPSDAPPPVALCPRRLARPEERSGPPADYELLDLIGQGGMGVVYAARQTAIDRTVAMKMMKDETASDAKAQAKFVSEAAVLGELEHPNIVPVYELGSADDGRLFCAMRYVRGVSWRDVIRHKTQVENVDILLRVADAVAFAHSRGVIHRDLKPENVMLGDFGEVLVMDWGIALTITGEVKAERITRETACAGTPAYMAPEMAQASARLISPASDIYLLGAVLYEIVTGQRPHAGETVMQCIYNAACNVIQPAEKQGELLDIAMKAMATDRAKRYLSVKDFQAAIREYQSHSDSVGLSARAQEDLVRAGETRSYDDFAKAIFGFREARELWPENRQAAEGALRAGLAYAACAFDKGDLDLAASLLSAETYEERQLLGQVTAAQKERRLRQRRMKALTCSAVGLAAVVMLVLAAAVVWVRHEQAKTERAHGETKKALARVEKEKGKLEYESYINAIALADARIRDLAFDQAERLLRQAPTEHRGWEWGRLAYVCRLDLLTMRGHTQMVTSAVFSPDGERIATTGFDGAARIWDARTGRELIVFGGHTGGIWCAAFRPDGRRIATGGEDKMARLWDADTGREVLALRGHAGDVSFVAFSPDGKLIATASFDKTARIWDAAMGKEICALKGHSNSVCSAEFSPDGRRIVTGSWDKTAKLWDAATGREVRTLRGHTDFVRCARFSPDGKRIVTASYDRTAAVWDAETGKEQFRLKGHQAIVLCATFSPDGKRIVTAGAAPDTAVRVWNAETGGLLFTLKGHSNSVYSAAFSPDMKRILTAGADLTARVWDATTDRETRTLRDQPGWTKGSVAFSPDGKRMVTASTDKTATVWDMEAGKPLMALKGHTALVKAVAFSPDGKLIATGGADNTARIWDATTGREIRTLEGHSNELMSVAFSPNGDWIVTGSVDKTARVWDAATGKEHLVLTGHSDMVASAVFSPDGRRVATAGRDDTAKLWDAATGKEILTLAGHSASVYSVAFSPDGGRIVTGSSDKTARIWNAADGKEIFTLKGHSDDIYAVAFSPDGKRIATGSRDRTVKIWDAATGRELLALKGHSVWIEGIAFSPTDRTLAAAAGDNTVLLYPALDWGKSLGELDAHPAGIYQHQGEVCQAEGNREEAIVNFTRAIQLDPDYAMAYYNRGRAYALKGEYHRAIADFTQAVRLNPKNVNAWSLRGDAHMQIADNNRALADYTRAIEIVPDWSVPYLKRAPVHLQRGDYDGAAADYGKAIALAPRDPLGYSGRGFVRMCQGAFAEAAADLAKAVELNPGDGYAPVMLFVASSRAGKSDAAALAKALEKRGEGEWPAPVMRMLLGKITPEECLAAAQDADPKIQRERTCEAHYYIGQFHLIRGQEGKARAHFEKCIATGLLFLEYDGAKAELRRLGK